MKHEYFAYILASRSRNLYTGVSSALVRRMVVHRKRLLGGFTSRYRVFRLAHFESYANVKEAIAREKEIKGWRREKKIWLIERRNPTWEDLAAQLPHDFQPLRGEDPKQKKADPSPPSANPRRLGSG